MHRIVTKAASVVGVIAALLAPGVPAGASAAPATGGAVALADPQFYTCSIPAERTRIIIFRYPRPNNGNNCVLGGELAFAALITHSRTSYTVKICNQIAIYDFFAQINLANPDGGATNTIFWYWDPAGGGCSLFDFPNPVRKFRASYDDYVSPWAAPYP